MVQLGGELQTGACMCICVCKVGGWVSEDTFFFFFALLQGFSVEAFG